ncbi:MAG: hypothetical protein IJD29_04155 [Anaerotignum sp.]|nr:hypothetical protein [Anaerotignum sp.]
MESTKKYLPVRHICAFFIGFVILIGAAVYAWSSSDDGLDPGEDIRLSYGEFLSLRDSGKEFILYIHRSSCKICAIVSDNLYDMQGHGLPVYSFNMESMMGTTEYDEAKLSLGFSYMPCFKYYRDGSEAAHLNNPLNDSYFDHENGTEREAYRLEMIDKVTAFIEAAASGDNLITEMPQSPVITGVRVEAPEDENP